MTIVVLNQKTWPFLEKHCQPCIFSKSISPPEKSTFQLFWSLYHWETSHLWKSGDYTKQCVRSRRGNRFMGSTHRSACWGHRQWINMRRHIHRSSRENRSAWLSSLDQVSRSKTSVCWKESQCSHHVGGAEWNLPAAGPIRGTTAVLLWSARNLDWGTQLISFWSCCGWDETGQRGDRVPKEGSQGPN